MFCFNVKEKAGDSEFLKIHFKVKAASKSSLSNEQKQELKDINILFKAVLFCEFSNKSTRFHWNDSKRNDTLFSISVFNLL